MLSMEVVKMLFEYGVKFKCEIDIARGVAVNEIVEE